MMLHYVIAIFVAFDAVLGSDQLSLRYLTPSQYALLERLIKIGSNACKCLHKWRPVCASNGLTYNNKSCIKCIPFIKVVHDGPCKGYDGSHEDGEVERESKERESEEVEHNEKVAEGVGDNEDTDGKLIDLNESE